MQFGRGVGSGRVVADELAVVLLAVGQPAESRLLVVASWKAEQDLAIAGERRAQVRVALPLLARRGEEPFDVGSPALHVPAQRPAVGVEQPLPGLVEEVRNEVPPL